KGLYERLPADLQQLAQLRLHHQEASLKELGQMMQPNMGKSAVNHRLKKLKEWAEED
ncbi:MAG TPA: DNA-binding protein WhiA, partial [Eubacteriaceae bacterium]|nr:DNA-binding protein WhiA [Eubacteriaceae bacterium]